MKMKTERNVWCLWLVLVLSACAPGVKEPDKDRKPEEFVSEIPGESTGAVTVGETENDQLTMEQNMKLRLWIEELSSGERPKIEAAVDAMVREGAAAVPMLMTGLRESQDVFVRLILVDVLARQRGGAGGVLDQLVMELAAERSVVREELARALNWIAADTEEVARASDWLSPALSLLSEDLGDEDMWVRVSAARALARLAPLMTVEQQAGFVPSLIDLIADPARFVFVGYFQMRPDRVVLPVQAAAVWALEQFDHADPRVGEALNEYYIRRLAEVLDLTAPGLEDFAAALREGRNTEALRMFNRQKVEGLALIDFDDPWLWWMTIPARQLRKNLHTNSNYDKHVTVTRYVGAPGAMDWLVHEPSNPNWGEQTSRMTWTGTLMTARLGGFPGDGDTDTLHHWLGIWSDFDSNFLHQIILAERYFEVLGYRRPSNARAAAGVRWPLHAAYRLEARIRGLAAAARRDPGRVTAELRDYGLAKLFLGAQEEIEQLTPWLTDAQVWKTGIPGNQLQHSASSVAQAMAAMLEFKDLPEWGGALELYATKLIPYYPDGTEGEQSYHYNVYLLEFASSCAKLFPEELRLPFLDRLLEMGQYRYRFLSSIVRPHDGMTPGEGMVNAPLHPEFQDVFEDPLVDTIVNITRTQTGSAPAFDSIVFPWSGYHVLRNGWLRDDTHLYLKGGRKGVGHKSASGCAIQLTAFGRELLTRGGRRSYGAGPFPGHNEYQLSSFGYNTIVVDGKSQRNENAPIQPDPIPARWLASPRLDFAEARYHSGYVDIDEAIEHHRQVIFVRDLNLFVVTDRIASGQERSYSQIWKFDRAFGKDLIQADTGGQILRTLDPAGPNVTLHHFADTPLQYETYFGQQHPEVRGWIGCEPHFPAVDVHANWQGRGPQQVVTVLRPTRSLESTPPQLTPLSSEGVNGFRLRDADGRGLEYWSAAAGVAVLGSGDIQVRGEVLLVRMDGDGARHGLALGVTELRLQGESVPVPSPGFTFRMEGGTWSVEDQVRAPEHFRWEVTEAGLVPSYWPEDGTQP